jgi:hypothetical protein
VTELELYKVNLIGAINSLTSLVSEELPSYKLMSIEALLTLDVHSRDILASLITQKVIIICLSFLNFKSNVSK